LEDQDSNGTSSKNSENWSRGGVSWTTSIVKRAAGILHNRMALAKEQTENNRRRKKFTLQRPWLPPIA
jgi:hypothetical protein